MRRSRAVSLAALGLALALAALVGGGWWWKTRRPPPAPIAPREIAFELGVYFLPTATTDPRAALDDVARGLPALVVSDGEPEPASGHSRVFRTFVWDVASSYAPPDAESLGLFGRGLSRQQAESLGRSRHALRLRFRVPPDRVWEGARAGYRLASAVARRTGGLVWDEETREVFGADAWDSQRIGHWREGTIPDISEHVVIHSYRNGDYLRAITLGMAKFGLPDLVVEEFAASNNREVGILLNLTAQALAEGANLHEGELTLRLAAIRHEGVRAEQIAALKPHAKPEVTLRMHEGRRDDGDPDNRLLEIGFDHYPGPDPRSRQNGLLADLLGWEDAITEVDHDETLLAASRRARARLPGMKALVAGGPKPGQFLMVKAPFAKPDGGNEWMWVEVVAWRGSRIRGVLANEPFEVPGLRAGQEVVVDEGDVFDYILRNPDGTEEGNETSQIIQAREKRE